MVRRHAAWITTCPFCKFSLFYEVIFCRKWIIFYLTLVSIWKMFRQGTRAKIIFLHLKFCSLEYQFVVLENIVRKARCRISRDTIHSVRGDAGYKLLLIVSYHFVRKAKSESIRDAYSSTLLAVSPEWIVQCHSCIHKLYSMFFLETMHKYLAFVLLWSDYIFIS
jgi:hypothetical protein